MVKVMLRGKERNFKRKISAVVGSAYKENIL
jgi:hypothetical protein